MKSAFKPWIFFIALALSFNSANALSGLSVFAGLSTPNDQINDVYNSEKIEWSDGALKNLYNKGLSSGYCVGVKGRMNLTDRFQITGSISWHKFPESDILVKDPTNGETIAKLTTATNIVPVTAGANYYLVNSILGVYALGELSYNYISTSVNYNKGSVPVSINESPKYKRVGFGVGAGLDVDLFLITFNLEAKYNIANLIGKVSGEKEKKYFDLTLGVIF